MITQILGQFVIATFLMHVLPVDTGFFEDQVGMSSGTFNNTNVTELFPIAQEREVIKYPVKVDPNSYGIVTSAQSALVVDKASGMMLLGKHPDSIRSIGSVTKLMTALVFLDEDPDLSQIVTLDPAIDLVEGGRIYLAFYDGMTLKDVLGASIVGSDNTATESLMRFSGLGREAFIERMNEKAKDLGMHSTTFTDPTGIDSSNMSTARDLMTLLQTAEQEEILHNYMTTDKLYITQNSGRVILIENTNQLLNSFLNQGVYRITGGKTGFLPQAGYVLATSVMHNADEIYVIVLGADSKDARVSEASSLAAWAFKVFEWPN